MQSKGWQHAGSIIGQRRVIRLLYQMALLFRSSTACIMKFSGTVEPFEHIQLQLPDRCSHSEFWTLWLPTL